MPDPSPLGSALTEWVEAQIPYREGSRAATTPDDAERQGVAEEARREAADEALYVILTAQGETIAALRARAVPAPEAP